MIYVIIAYAIVGTMISMYGISLHTRFRRARKEASAAEGKTR